MGSIILPSDKESELAGSWAILGVEMPRKRGLVDHVRLRRNVYHSFLALVDYTDPENPDVKDEIHFNPYSKTGKTIKSRLMTEAIGRLGGLHMSKTFHDVSKAIGLDRKMYFLKDMHYVASSRNAELAQMPKASYFDNNEKAVDEVWREMVAISEDIGEQEIPFINGIINCRTGAKAVIEKMGGEFITVVDDPDVYAGQDTSYYVLDHLNSRDQKLMFHSPFTTENDQSIIVNGSEIMEKFVPGYDISQSLSGIPYQKGVDEKSIAPVHKDDLEL